MKKTEFKHVPVGGVFSSSSGQFEKINDHVARRTDRHWQGVPKTWPFSPIDTVYVAEDTTP